jgi:uncharacterized protein (TIGR02246 family)
MLSAVRRNGMLLGVMVLIASVHTSPAHPSGLSATDVDAIRRTCEGFRDAWLRNDAAGVMRLLTADVVIMPHHGVRPREGAQAVRAFWWPKGATPATVTRFEHEHDEIGGDGSFAFVRGRATIEYTWAPAQELRLFRNVGTTLTLLRRVESGEWLISHRMWDDPPTEDLGSADGRR